MATGILDTVKRAAIEAVKASNPVSIAYGTVIGVNPLQVRINPYIILNEADGVLIVARSITDYTVDVTLDDWNTETSGNHSHAITGTKKMTIRNGLKIDDIVILLKMQGGQRYVAIDKVGG